MERFTDAVCQASKWLKSSLVKLRTNCGDQSLISGIGGLLGGLLPYLNRTRIA